jgi:Spy/CpxP family protein refolding chaperone
MRNLIITFALAGLLALGAAPAARGQSSDSGQSGTAAGGQSGQRHRHGRMDPDAQLQRMTQQLGLSADQQKQIRPILVDRQQKMQAVWQNQSLSREDRRSQMMSIREDTRGKIEAVLTDEQKQTFEATQERRGRRGGEPQSQPQPQ